MFNQREIKFRAKTVKTGEWIYFTLRDLGQGTFKGQFIWDTVCQYVNIEDKNKREIYEKDTLKVPDYGKPKDKERKDCEDRDGVVFFSCSSLTEKGQRDLKKYNDDDTGLSAYSLKLSDGSNILLSGYNRKDIEIINNPL